MHHPLLTLKLRIPPLRLDCVPRQHLCAQLDLLLQPGKRLALVCAPAGYGKTSLVAAWIVHLSQGKAPSTEHPDLAWLSLDDADNNPAYFLLYLIEAFKKTLLPQQVLECQSICEVLDGSQAVTVQDVLTVLLNGLSQFPHMFVLVLDDYHFITNPEVHECLKYLLVNLPSNIRLLLATRVDPPLGLAQLRARDQVVEIRTAGLQFTLPEITEFIRHTMGLPLSAAQIAILAGRTEGWAVGLQMAALSLQGRDDPGAFIQAFGGSHRFVLEYLLEEVLNRQPPAVQEFLIRTSIFERFNAQACDFLLEQPNTSQPMLDILERMNLFLVPLDDEGSWYRYHQLFASLLRSRLRLSVQADTVQALYCRASQWYENAGLLADAIAQALAAPELTYAADLLERHCLTFFYQSEIAQVHRWLAALPETLLLQRALLCAVYAASKALLPPYPPNTLPAAESWMQSAESALANDIFSSKLARTFIYAIRSYWARFRGEPPGRVLDLIANASALLPADSGAPMDHNQLYIRSALQANLGLTYWNAGDEQAAWQAFTQARDFGLACDDLFNASSSINNLVKIHCLHGQLVEAALLCREALAYFDSHQVHLGHRAPFSSELGIQLAEILIEKNELAEAESLLKENIELGKWTMSHNVLVFGQLGLARLAVAHGDPDAAFGWLEQCEKISPFGAGLAGAWRASIWLALCDKHPQYLSLARQCAQRWSLVEYSPGPLLMEWTISLTLARLILFEATCPPVGKTLALSYGLADLLGWLERQELAMQARGWAHWDIQLRVIECLTRRVLGDKAGSQAALRQALELARPGGYVRLFVEAGDLMRLSLLELGVGEFGSYGTRLLAGFPAAASTLVQPAAPGKPAVDALTGREMEVLHLICQGLSNQDIARRLFVTLNTIKKHNYSIFQKMGVPNRAQAILAAQEQGLIQENDP